MNYSTFILVLSVVCALGSLRFAVLTENSGLWNRFFVPFLSSCFLILPLGSLGYLLYYATSFLVVKILTVIVFGSVIVILLVFSNSEEHISAYNDPSCKPQAKEKAVSKVIHCDSCMACAPLTLSTAYSIGHDGGLPNNHKTGVYRICCEDSFKRLYEGHGHKTTPQALAKSQSIARKHLKYKGKG